MIDHWIFLANGILVMLSIISKEITGNKVFTVFAMFLLIALVAIGLTI